METRFNQKWGGGKPLVSIITTVYNRRLELPRAIESVKNCSFRDFEYIIVDDGSIDSVDDIVANLMNEEEFPVAYIKKTNGGVHTARNRAISVARGDLLYNLDSDDEVLPLGIEKLVSAWEDIPYDKKEQYREVVGRAQDQNGSFFGKLFPRNINQLPYDQVRKIRRQCTSGHQQAIWDAKIMKANPWPEPQGVTFVAEGLLWKRLNVQYKSWLINDLIMTYHKETPLSYTSPKRGLTNQQLINNMYNALEMVNHSREWELTLGETINRTLYYGINRSILRQRDTFPFHLGWAQQKVNNRFLWLCMQIPIFISTFIFKKKYRC